MIPKIIHYCWFGGNPKSELIQKCMASWKKFCPDYEIKEWNESNFDVNCCQYVKEAYEMKKWAFVSDYCRFKVLHDEGGMYVDTDVEFIKPVDEFLKTPFMAFERDMFLNPGLICAAEKGDRHCKNILEEYEKDSFRVEGGDGEAFNPRTVCHRATDEFVRHGLVLDGSMQQIDGYTIYPTEYFNPFNYDTGVFTITPKTCSVHHCAGSWLRKGSHTRGKIYRFLYRHFGQKTADFVKRIFGRKN